MAIVAEYKFDKGTVTIRDDAYAGISEAEIARRVREAQRTAWRIWEAEKLRERAAGETDCRGPAALAMTEGGRTT